jgi:hypothetical protein
MTDMKAKAIPLVLLGLMLLGSCTEEIKPKKYTYSQLLTGQNNKTWKLNRIALRQAGKEEETLSLAPCQSDDRYIFYSNDEKLYEVKNGSQKCDQEEESLLLSYEWSFTNANANLTMVIPHVFGYFLIPFIVKSIDNADMEVEVFLDEEATVSYVLFFKRTDEA